MICQCESPSSHPRTNGSSPFRSMPPSPPSQETTTTPLLYFNKKKNEFLLFKYLCRPKSSIEQQIQGYTTGSFKLRYMFFFQDKIHKNNNKYLHGRCEKGKLSETVKTRFCVKKFNNLRRSVGILIRSGRRLHNRFRFPASKCLKRQRRKLQAQTDGKLKTCSCRMLLESGYVLETLQQRRGMFLRFASKFGHAR